jgi:hypothetical protein
MACCHQLRSRHSGAVSSLFGFPLSVLPLFLSLRLWGVDLGASFYVATQVLYEQCEGCCGGRDLTEVMLPPVPRSPPPHQVRAGCLSDCFFCLSVLPFFLLLGRRAEFLPDQLS